MNRLCALSVLALGCAATVQSTADGRDASVRDVPVIPDVLIAQDITVSTDIPETTDSPDAPDGACSLAPPEGAPAGGTVVPIGATAALSPRVGGFGHAWIFPGRDVRYPWAAALLHRNGDIELTRYGAATLDTVSTTVPASAFGVTFPYDDLRVDAFDPFRNVLMMRATARTSGRPPFAFLRSLSVDSSTSVEFPVTHDDLVIDGRGDDNDNTVFFPVGRDGSPASRPVSYASLAVERIITFAPFAGQHDVIELEHPGRFESPRVIALGPSVWVSAVIDAGAPRSVWIWHFQGLLPVPITRIPTEGGAACSTSSYDVAIGDGIAWVEDCLDGAVRVSVQGTHLRQRIGTTMPNRSPSRIAWNGTHFAVVYRAPREDGPTLQLIDPVTGLAAGGPVHIPFPPGALIPDYLQLGIAGAYPSWGVIFAGLPATNLVPTYDTYLARMGGCGTNAP